MGHHAHVIEELAGPTNDLRRAQPEAWTAFNALHRAAMADGAVPRRIKELIALAVAVSEHCDGCIAYHAKAAARHGASREEVGEVLSVALLMGGGPATTYAPRAWAAFVEFAGDA
jgi:AhpD family alkylhydroperoxidase